MRAISGMTTFISADENFGAVDKKIIELYSVDRKLARDQLFAVNRAKNSEEVSQARSVRIAAYSLIILIIMQIADWFIRYYWKF